jgi:predicted nucleic acid-binding protein
MPRRVLDTNILINFWAGKVVRHRAVDITARDAAAWAKELIELQGTDAILTPIYIEYVCGQGDENWMKLARAYLDEFDIVDDGRILPADWKVATQIAHRILRDRSPRQLGDCIIRAICKRLHLEVLTADRRFPN